MVRSRNVDASEFSVFSNEAVYIAQLQPAQPSGVSVTYLHGEQIVADRYWVGDTDSDWNDSNNWASTSGGAGGAGVPGASDDVIFDGSYTTANCTADVAIDIASIDVQSTYGGTLDFADSSYSHAIGGDATFDGSGTIDLGNSTLTISGNLDNIDQTTFTSDTSTIVMDGASTTILSTRNHDLVNLTISADVEILIGTTYSLDILGVLTVDAGATFTLGQGVDMRPGSSLVNNGIIHVNNGIILSLYSSTFSTIGTLTNNTTGKVNLLKNNTINGGTFGIPVYAHDYLGNGTLTINGNIVFQDDFQFDSKKAGSNFTFNNGGNHNLTFQKDVLFTETAGTIIYTKGTGTITISGTIAQDIDFNGETVEDIVIDKSTGTVTLSGAVVTDSLAVNRGTLDIDGQAVDVTANVTSTPTAGAVTFQDTTATGTLSITGNLDLNGTVAYGVTWTDVDIDVLSAGGSNEASYATVSNSNNSTGNTITVTNGTDSGGNTGWDFGAAPAEVFFDHHIDEISYGTRIQTAAKLGGVLVE